MTRQVTDKRFITFPQLAERWGNCSDMYVERRLRADPNFPKVYRFGGRVRFLDLTEVERYERSKVVDRPVEAAS
jgi:hypothetical protein